jgi:cytochrome c553
MSPAARWFAVFCPVALGGAVLVGARAAGDTPPPAALAGYYPGDRAPPVAPPPPVPAQLREYDHTALGALVRANGGRVPASGAELVAALRKLGPVSQLPVPFSAVAMTAGLANPRVVIAATDAPAAKKAAKPARPEARGKTPPADEAVALSAAGVTQAGGVAGRLFLAANLEPGADGKPRARAVEFISWNPGRKRFDFGVIAFAGGAGEVHFADAARCAACHKNDGPILGQGPWSNSVNNDVVRAAAFQKANAPGATNPFAAVIASIDCPPARPFPPPTLSPRQVAATTSDGVSVVAADPEACDAAVRRGGDLPRDRQVFRALANSPDGRKALALLLTAIAVPGPLDKADAEARPAIEQALAAGGSRLAEELAAIRRGPSGVLIDFSPSGSAGTLRGRNNETVGWGGGSSPPAETLILWGGSQRQVTEYDARRAGGEPGLPAAHRPSNPLAFVRDAAPAAKPAAAVGAAALARTIGLTEGDRKFLAESLAGLAARMVGARAPANLTTAVPLAQKVFAAPAFADVLGGELPDREEFKERFVAALGEVAKAHRVPGWSAPARAAYASGPLPPADGPRAAPAAPATACLRCHDVRGAGRQVFDPIPALAFDPFDPVAREAWAERAGPKARAEAVGLMLRRLHADKDMPPADSAEHRLFRLKEPAAFDEARKWLEAEAKAAAAE